MEVLAALIWVFSMPQVAIAFDTTDSFYEKQENFSCSAVESAADLTGVKCTAKCNLMTDKLCAGVSYNDSYCNLCLACLNPVSPVWLPPNSAFKRSSTKLAASLQEGMFIYPFVHFSEPVPSLWVNIPNSLGQFIVFFRQFYNGSFNEIC